MKNPKNLKALLGHLNDTTRRTLSDASVLTQTNTNYEVTIEHLLLKMLDGSNTDVRRILAHFGVDSGRVTKELTNAIERFQKGNASIPAFSPRVVAAFSEAWVLASIEFGASSVRTGHVLLWSTPTSPQALDQFTVDLTARARQGEIDPVTGRDFEIRQLVDILMRRRQNNPILTGEAGVGKTAVVEGVRVAASPRATCRRRCATSPCARSIWGCCRPAPASRASSRTG